MASKPLIGLNSDYRGEAGERPAYSCVTAGYVDCILASGGIPVILPPLADRKDVEAAVEPLQACVMIGGGDLDPRRDGFMLHPTVKPMDPRREDFDRILMDVLAENRIPVLGIGVGMQLLNISQGGNLFLHIPEDMPTALPHRDPQDAAHRHSLEVVPGTLMERVYGDGEIRVNSRHHMAIDELAPGFLVTARCPDGIVEAIEYQGEDWVAVGTQFHPESHSASALDSRVFEEFIGEATSKKKAVRLVA